MSHSKLPHKYKLQSLMKLSISSHLHTPCSPLKNFLQGWFVGSRPSINLSQPMEYALYFCPNLKPFPSCFPKIKATNFILSSKWLNSTYPKTPTTTSSWWSLRCLATRIIAASNLKTSSVHSTTGWRTTHNLWPLNTTPHSLAFWRATNNP